MLKARSTSLDKGSSTATAYPSKSDTPFPVATLSVNVTGFVSQLGYPKSIHHNHQT